MNPTGTILYLRAAVRSRLRARSLAASSSKATWLKRARAFRTCDLSLIGSRRRPFESTYAKAVFGNRARFFELSWPMMIRSPCPARRLDCPEREAQELETPHAAAPHRGIVPTIPHTEPRCQR